MNRAQRRAYRQGEDVILERGDFVPDSHLLSRYIPEGSAIHITADEINALIGMSDEDIAALPPIERERAEQIIALASERYKRINA